ncbi:putative esterase YheT [Nymphon striatum]|nr:putative esterase YheT [Nymphon striatum]
MRKPVVILKSSHDNGSYSDAIAKTKDVRAMDDVFHAAVLRAGADHVSTLTNLYAAAKILASNQRTKGSNLAIISNGNAPVMLANDRLRDLGITTARLSKELITDLKSTSNSNFSSSKEVDAIAIILAPDPLIDSVNVATEVAKTVKSSKKPILGIWMGTASGGQGRRLLTDENISNYRTPEAAMDAFSFLSNHLANRQRILQVPYPLKKTLPPNVTIANEIIDKNLEQKRNVLSRIDAIWLLEAFNIKCNQSLHAETLEEALEIAEDIGYPVALKIDSQNITYKSDVEGVKLNIQTPKMLKKAYLQIKKSISELRDHIIIDGIIIERMHAPSTGRLLNISILNDPAFGPIITFGTWRKKRLVNDVQIVVQKAKSNTKHFDHLAIHPYPSDWLRSITIKKNKKVEVRPIRGEDAQAEIEFMNCMSSESKYFRFMHAVNDLTPEMLSRFTKLDYDREMAFGAFIQKKKKDKLLRSNRSMPIIKSNFKPAWWLRNPHLQTLWPTFFKKRPDLDLEKYRLELEDSDFIDISFTQEINQKPIVLIVHGLEGTLESHYAKPLIKQLNDNGYGVLFMHFRGCSGTPNRLRRSYHSGDSADLQTVIKHIKEKYKRPPLAIIGFSLGGNVLLKWLGEQQENANTTTAIAVSVPFKLADAADRLEKSFSRVYQKHLIITAPLHGFENADDYYSQSSSRQFINTIKKPTLIIHSSDDPFMWNSTVPDESEISENVHLELSDFGGHVGFINGKHPWKTEYWMDKRILGWLQNF